MHSNIWSPEKRIKSIRRLKNSISTTNVMFYEKKAARSITTRTYTTLLLEPISNQYFN